MISRYMCEFSFEASEWPHITSIGDKCTLKDNDLQLLVTDDAYPINDPQYIKTRSFTAAMFQSYLGIQCLRTEPADTTIKYRLYSGAGTYYWDGVDWVDPGADPLLWNTHAQLQVGFKSFALSTFGVWIRLETTDKDATPVVNSIRFIYQSAGGEIEGLIVNTLMAGIGSMPVQGRVVFAKEATSTKFDTSEFQLEAPIKISGIKEIYKYTSSPDYRKNLFSSWDGISEVTMTESVDAGDDLYVVFEVLPDVRAAGSQQYLEFRGIPCVGIIDISSQGKREIAGDWSLIHNEGEKKAYRFKRTTCMNVQVGIELLANGFFDALAFMESFSDFAYDNQVVSDPSGGTRMQYIPGVMPLATGNRVQRATATLLFHNVYELRGMVQEYIVIDFDAGL